MGFKVLYILLVIGMLGNVKIIFYMYILYVLLLYFILYKVLVCIIL